MKYALVTGGSRGIGKAISVRLASQGIPVIINYKSHNLSAIKTAKEIQSKGGLAELLPFDVSDSSSINDALKKWEAAHPKDYIGILINNAGLRNDNLMIFMGDDEWHNVLDTSLNAFFYITRRLLRNMIRKREGRIINIASLSGVKGMAGQINYSSAKGAIIAATKTLAQEVGSQNITVNAVAPGFIKTDMTSELNEEKLKTIIPVGRFGRPEEVAAIVSFLACEEASYITGEVININGGLYT